jgi:hypothetical protein
MPLENDFTRVFGAIKEIDNRVSALEEITCIYVQENKVLTDDWAKLRDENNQLRFILSILAAVKDDGWIEWHGGECPTDGFEEVDFMTRDGTMYDRELAETVLWEHENKHYDTVAWRFAR